MKRLLFVTTIGLLSYLSGFAQANVFDPADPIITYNAGAPAGSQQNPLTNWGNMQKWVVTPRFTWDSSYFKAYHFNGVSFRVMFPRSYQHNVNDGKKYPVLLFFHGAGEKGTIYDNELQLLHGGEFYLNLEKSGQFDAFLIFPQNTGGSFGEGYYEPSIRLMDSLAKYCKLDIDRTLIMGLSAGGQAVYEMLGLHPDRIAKAVPESAASTGALSYINSFIHIPIWMCTGGLDVNPHPTVAQQVYEGIKNAGADMKWTLYPTLGHFVWNQHWLEPGFFDYINDLHKANPLVYYQHNQFCPDTPINARLGITAGFAAYEWTKDNVTIPGATSNEYVATTTGTYRVRFKRTLSSNWSDWSPKPAVISLKAISVTPDIQVLGLRSRVLPAPDGSTTIPLREPNGYAGYEWYRVSDSALVGTDTVFNAPVGQFKARIHEQFGCSAFYSPIFTVVNANGPNKPDAARNLSAYALSPTSIQLEWSDNPTPAFNETNFEIYRSNSSGGPYKLIALTAADVLSYADVNLTSNQKYYYIVRAINNTAGSANSNQAVGTTKVDNIAPSTPANLKLVGVTRFSAFLQWDAATDNVGVDKYDVFVNGAKLYSTNQTNFIVPGLDSFQNYNFSVKARDAAGNSSAASSQVTAFTKLQGLVYYYYQVASTELPDFTTLPIVKAGMTPTTDYLVRTRDFQNAFLWQGYIKIPTSGTYTFESCSADGSNLYVNQYYTNDANVIPVVNNDGSHGLICHTGNVTLNAGIYPIAITYLNQWNPPAMDLYWSGPTFTRQLIPTTAFADVNAPSGTIPAADL